MCGNDLCHVRCYIGYASVAMHPMLVDNMKDDSQEETN
jgi:hypothetical protein